MPVAGSGVPSPEYAQPLLPPWVLALALLLLLVWPVPRPRSAAMPIAIPRQGPCGPGWLVTPLRSGGYVLRAVGGPAVPPLPCTIAVAAGAVLHASGDAALIRLGSPGGTQLFVPEGGWWGVPLTRPGTLQVVPFHPGSHLQLAVYDRWPSP